MDKPSNQERLAIGLLFALFFAVNLSTATRFPIPWMDEVLFVDPAANLYFNGSFTTTAYGWERSTEFHAHHPLYSLLLAGWFRITGFGLLNARTFNYLLVTLTALSVWIAVLRTGLVPSATYRLLLVLLLLFGYSVSFPYRAGRIEPLFMLLSAISFLVFTIENRRWRVALLGGSMLLFAPAGFSLLTFAGIFTLLVVLYLGKQVFVDIAVVWSALVLSVVVLFTVYATHGVWENALVAINLHTATQGLGTLVSEGAFQHHNRLPKDPSLMVLLGLVGLLITNEIKGSRFKWSSVLSFGLACSIAIPLAFLIFAKFPSYYSWMVYGPLAICICSTLSRMNAGRLLTLGMRSGLVLACVTGLPLQLFAVTYDWRDRDYDAVHQVVSANVREVDRVLCDYQAYFAAKSNAAEVFLPDYVRLMSADEKSKVTLLIGSDDALKRWRYTLGGQWSLAAQVITPGRESILQRLTGQNTDVGLLGKKYRFKIYRRQTDTSPFPEHF